MDPQHQLNGVHSPRNQVELHQQLGQFDEKLDFQEGHNPFSYYDEDNKRDMASSDEEGIAPAIQETPPNNNDSLESPSKQSSTIDQKFIKVEVGANLTGKPPINLVQSPKNNKNAELKAQKSSTPSIKLIKETEFDLGSIGNKDPPKNKPVPFTDRVYKSQLQNDMEDLKRKFLGKDTKKKGGFFEPKNDEKINLNKTFSNMAKKQGKQTNFEFEQMRMLIKMGFQKKKTNYEMLKEWDRKRAESLALHGKIIETLQNEVDIRIKSSLQNFEYYQTFFRQKAKQQQKYASSPVINTRYALQNNSLSKNVYINCSVILNSLCDENTNRCKKINDFIQLIRNNILKELTENHLSSSQRQLLKVRQKISTLKSALKKQNSQTEERANELAALFNEQASNITNTTDKDFYRTQLSFLSKALQQIEIQRKLGEYCLEYYHTAVQQELKRSKVIREAMVTYSKGLKNTYYLQPGLECPEIQQLSKQEQIKLIEQFFNLDEMFDERTIEMFKHKNQINSDQDISIETFTKYINNFDYHAFDCRILLLKEFNVRHITGKGKEAKEEPCFLAITVDNFLHLFFNHSKTNSSKPDITIKIGSKSLQMRNAKDETLEVVKKEERRHSMMSYFWDNRVEKIYRLRFSKKDNKEEFIDYISKLMVDLF